MTPEPVDRQGGWLDTIIIVEEPATDTAVIRLEAGDLDVYAVAINEPDIAQMIFDSDVLDYETAYGNYVELTFMPSTEKEFNDGRLNPFFSPKIREAMNWLVDRDYIAEEITGGIGAPEVRTHQLRIQGLSAAGRHHNGDRAEILTQPGESRGDNHGRDGNPGSGNG